MKVAAGCDNASGGTEVATELFVHGMEDLVILIGTQKLEGEVFGDANFFAAARFPMEFRVEWDGTGKVDAAHAVGAEFVLEIFQQSKAEAGLVNAGAMELFVFAGSCDDAFLIGQANALESEEGTDVVGLADFF